MTNKEIASTFKDLGAIMELHGENPFKIKSYNSAYITLRKWDQPLVDMSLEEIQAIKGVGKAISSKIRELADTGDLETMQKYRDKTPVGIQEMLRIKGFGPKKVKVVWKDLEVESVGELLYACNENRLIELKGFGQKTQDDLIKKIEYFLQSKDKFHYARIEKASEDLIAWIQEQLSDASISLTGAMRRKDTIIEVVELLIDGNVKSIFDEENLILESSEGNIFKARTAENLPVIIYQCSKEEFGSKLFQYTATSDFLNAFIKKYPKQSFKNIKEEATIFEQVSLPFIVPELREDEYFLERISNGNIPNLITNKEIKGVLHTHTTYSDGLHSLEDMVKYAQSQGYEYIGITDHSKSAFYANGLKEDRVLEQMQAIDALNTEMDDFVIYKGIESDILNDGSLDYSEDLLAQFDFIIASVHSNLKMDETKATNRLIKAIENPYTTILGHPTGRLLLSREGYPIDFQKVIDACAANGVSIELNANPLRLDIDWKWIPYALEKGVYISINPDAHSKEGIHDIQWGVLAGRKGGLSAAQCLCRR